MKVYDLGRLLTGLKMSRMLGGSHLRKVTPPPPVLEDSISLLHLRIWDAAWELGKGGDRERCSIWLRRCCELTNTFSR